MKILFKPNMWLFAMLLILTSGISFSQNIVQQEAQRELAKHNWYIANTGMSFPVVQLPTNEATAPTGNITLNFSGTLELADPVFNRPLSIAQGGSCALSGVGTAVHYDTYTYTTTTSGNVTISIKPGDGATITPSGADTYIALYGPGGFNPASPCTNFIASNDDDGGSALSRIVTTTPLAPGTYTIVFTSFDNTPSSPNALPWSYTLKVITPDPATCAAPSGVAVSGVNNASAILSWTAASPAPTSGYQYYISTGSTPPSAATAPTGAVDPGTSASLLGLLPGTTYYTWVRSNCGSSSYSAWVPAAAFTTISGEYCISNGRITNTDPTHSPRLLRPGTALPVCGVAFTSPGTASAGTYSYDIYPFTNSSAFTKCVSFTIDESDISANLMLAVYNGSFDPTNPETNLMASSTLSTGNGIEEGPVTFSVNIPASTTIQVVVTEVTPGDYGTSDYSLLVNGLPCGATACTPVCPSNITVAADPALCGAIVNFPVACGTASPASGTVFPIGTTMVSITPPATSVVLYQQSGAKVMDITSQDFETSYDAFDSKAADDFVVPAGQVWKIEKVSAAGFGPFGGVVNVEFYNNAGSLPGTVIQTYNNVNVSGPGPNLSITLPSALILSAGTYWVSVQVVQPSTSGQWFWNDFGTTSINSEYAWKNPGGAFGATCVAYSPISTCIPGHGKNLVFSIEGIQTSAACNFLVTVTPPPCPANVTAAAAPGVCSAPVSFALPCGATSTPASGSTFPVGTTNVTVTFPANAYYSYTTDLVDGIGSQNFEPANDTWDNFSADDFVVPIGQTFTLTQVAARGIATTNLTSFNVIIYNNASGVPGTIIQQFNNITVAATSNPSLTLPSPVVLSAGTYWVCVQANANFAAGERWFWAIDGTNPINNAGVFQRVTSACPTWTPVPSCPILGTPKYNFDLKVYGYLGAAPTCTFSVTVSDNQNPTITCPANITTNTAAGVCTASVVTPNPTTGDNCGVTTLTWAMTGATTGTSPATGINNVGTFTFNRGVTTITYTVKDAAGNTTTCSFTVTVNDNQNPTISCQANVTTNAASGACSASVVTTNPTTADNCGVTALTWAMTGATVAISPATGINNVGTYVFNVGVTTVTYTAKDAQGNISTCSFTVTVNDTQPPTITCPANITVSNDPNLCSAVVTFSQPTASDNCNKFQAPKTILPHGAGALTFAGNNASGGFMFNLTNNSTSPKTITGFSVRFGAAAFGAVTSPQAVGAWVTTTANTYIGNQTNAAAWTDLGTSTVTLAGTNAEFSQFTLPSSFTLAPGQTKGVFIFGQAAGLVYNSGANSNTTPITNGVLTVTPGEARGTAFTGTGLSPRIPNVIINYITLTQTAGLPSGSAFPVGTTTNTFQATDDAGNSSTCSFTVKVNDTQLPTITCPGNITVNTPVGSCTAVVNYNATLADNCPGATLVMLSGLASGSAFPIGTTTVVLRARDAAGNLSPTCSFTVTVNDAQLPVISVQPLDKVVCAGQNVSFSVTATNVTSYQWQVMSGNSWTDIAGATSSSYSFVAQNADNNKKYRVVLRGLCSTIISREADLRVNSLPTVTLGSYYSAIWPGMTTTVTAAGSAWGGNYQFYFNGNPVGGNTSNNVWGPVGVDGIGSYNVVYTDVNGCSARAATDLVLGGKASNLVFVYPNPNNGQFQVRFNNVNGEQAWVLVFNSAGQVVFKKAFTNGSATYSRMDVNLGLTAGGMYEVKVVGKDNRVFGATQVIIKR